MHNLTVRADHEEFIHGGMSKRRASAKMKVKDWACEDTDERVLIDRRIEIRFILRQPRRNRDA